MLLSIIKIQNNKFILRGINMKKIIAMLLIAGTLLSSSGQALAVGSKEIPTPLQTIGDGGGGGTGCSHHFVTTKYYIVVFIVFAYRCEFCGADKPI